MDTTSNTIHTKRLFIAVPVCDEINKISETLMNANSELQGVKWTPQKNLHLTIFFLGETNTVFIPDILKAMENVLMKTPVFELDFEKVSLEGARTGHPSMVWARFRKHPLYSGLVKEFKNVILPFMNVIPKFDNPVPHVTLARIRSGTPPELPVFSGCSIKINGFELWESIKIPGGVEYNSIGEKYHR